MKLQYTKKLRPYQPELTVMTSKGVYKFLKVGDVVDVSDEAASECIASSKGCLELYKEPVKAVKKVTKAPKNKKVEVEENK